MRIPHELARSAKDPACCRPLPAPGAGDSHLRPHVARTSEKELRPFSNATLMGVGRWASANAWRGGPRTGLRSPCRLSVAWESQSWMPRTKALPPEAVGVGRRDRERGIPPVVRCHECGVQYSGARGGDLEDLSNLVRLS